jgi:hypothetical protein
MLRCPRCQHRICHDELTKASIEPGSPDVTLVFQCQACDHKVTFIVYQGLFEDSVHITPEQKIRLSPGRLVNECRGREMMAFEEMGPITVNEVIEFGQRIDEEMREIQFTENVKARLQQLTQKVFHG